MKLHLNQEFTIVKEWTAPSKNIKTWGVPTIYIIFKGVLDGEEYKTYIVEGFKNNRLWQEILSRSYKKLRIRFSTGRLRGNVIDADSYPEIVGDGDQDKVNDLFNH